MINLSLDEIRLIAQIGKISNYENKSKEDLIKALCELKPERSKQTLKPEAKPKQTPKQTPKTKLKPKTKVKPEPKIEIKVNRKKLKKIRKDFDELRHKFSNKDEIYSLYRKSFYDIKNYRHIYDPNIKNHRHLFESEIKKATKHINKSKKSLKSKKFQGSIDSVDYKDPDNYDNNYDFADDVE